MATVEVGSDVVEIGHRRDVDPGARNGDNEIGPTETQAFDPDDALIGECGASIQEITHDRAFAGPDVTAVNVRCTVETRDRAHIDELFAKLHTAGFRLERAGIA